MWPFPSISWGGGSRLEDSEIRGGGCWYKTFGAGGGGAGFIALLQEEGGGLLFL